ncbi:glycosyltransferase family 2 protein [Geodermatophilus arenarius]
MTAAPPGATGAPRVSVICIFYNGEQFLDEAIRSVMAQSTGDFEFLLCDDGSTDGSTSMALGWQARHPGQVRYLQHPDHANRGMSATRNLGLDAARGEFIAFIDADDVWRPEKLTEQMAIMDAHPGLGMVCGTVNYWWSWAGGEDVLVPTGHVRNRVVPPPEASLALYPLGTASAPCPSDMLLRREAVQSVGGFEAHFTGARQMYEDQGFLGKLYLSWPVWFSDAVWLDYRQHPDSSVASVTRAGRYHEVRQYYLDWFERHLDSRAEPAPPAVRAALARALRPYRRPVLHALAAAPARLTRLPRAAMRRARAALRGHQ